MFDLYGGRDPRDLARYPVSEAARLLDVPRATVGAWAMGRSLPGRGALVPLIEAAAPGRLSFTNLVELHVLRAMRKVHRVPMGAVREALDQLPGPHPLATRAFFTDGVDLFVEELGRRVKLSNSQQLGFHEELRLHLQRIERDEAGLAQRLFPYMGEARVAAIDPNVAFGRPVLVGTGIPLENLIERYNAGEPEAELAMDFGVDESLVRDAIRATVRSAA